MVSFSGPLFEMIDNPIDEDKIYSAAFDEIEQDFNKEMKKIYQTNNWKRNDLHYLLYGKQKGKEGSAPGRKPGIRTGAVRKALTTGRGVGALRKRNKNNLEMGVSKKLDYLKYSQGENSQIPKRDPFEKINTKVLQKWNSIVVEKFLDYYANPSRF